MTPPKLHSSLPPHAQAHASLPMYDWPEVQGANDRLWAAMRDSLRGHGFDAPESLTRVEDYRALWTDGGLFLSQTCGLPLVTLLGRKVMVVGTPAYDIDCGGGSYYSVLVVRTEEGARGIADFSGSRYAFNDPLSQSGYSAFHHAMLKAGRRPGSWGEAVQTGSHRNSIKAVSEGRADIAAIDAVTWELAKRHEKAALDLRVLARTAPTPGLPVITSPRKPAELDRMHIAISEAYAGLDDAVRDALFITGFAPTGFPDYNLVASRWAEVQAAV